MNLVLDLGNTAGKIAVCEGPRVVESTVYEKVTGREISYFNTRYPQLKGVIVSSVVNDSREMIDYLGNLFPVCIELHQHTPLPLRNLYQTPETLGYDRIAAAVGAYTIFPGKNVLVIDTGTAITSDVVTSSGEYLGGNISPGLDIRFRALNKFTSRLPQVERPGEQPPLVGATTRQAIEAGVVNGIIFELDGWIRAMEKEYPKIQVVLTGGDAHYFEGKLKSSIFVDLHLNLIGLNSILEYNASEKS